MEYHRGLDVRAPVGTPVLAPIDCVIGGIFDDEEGGKCILLCGQCPDGTYPDPATYFFQTAVQSPGAGGHDDSGWRITYCHLSGYPATAQLGAVVKRGDVVAFSGNTGRRSDGSPVAPHLHIQVEWLQDGLWDSRVFVDPLLLFGDTISRRKPVNALPPGKHVAPNSAVIVPAGQPGNTGQKGSVVINVDGKGMASVNLGNGASLAGNVNVAMPGGDVNTGGQ